MTADEVRAWANDARILLDLSSDDEGASATLLVGKFCLETATWNEEQLALDELVAMVRAI